MVPEVMVAETAWEEWEMDEEAVDGEGVVRPVAMTVVCEVAVTVAVVATVAEEMAVAAEKAMETSVERAAHMRSMDLRGTCLYYP